MTSASCGCPAGSARRCKHIQAVFYYVNNEPIRSKTDKLCEWNKLSFRHMEKKSTRKRNLLNCFPKKRDIFSLINTDINCELRQILLQEKQTEGSQVCSYILNNIKEKVTEVVSTRNISEVLSSIFSFVDFNNTSNMNNLESFLPEGQNFYKTHICLEISKIKQICISTVMQSAFDTWHELLKVRISASTRAHQIKTLTRKDPAKLAALLNPEEIQIQEAFNTA